MSADNAIVISIFGAKKNVLTIFSEPEFLKTQHYNMVKKKNISLLHKMMNCYLENLLLTLRTREKITMFIHI